MNQKMMLFIILFACSGALFGMQEIKIPNANVLKERLNSAGFGKFPTTNAIVALLADQNKDPQDIVNIVSQALHDCDDVAKKSLLEDRLLKVLCHDNMPALRAFLERREKENYEFMKGSC